MGIGAFTWYMYYAWTLNHRAGPTPAHLKEMPLPDLSALTCLTSPCVMTFQGQLVLFIHLAHQNDTICKKFFIPWCFSALNHKSWLMSHPWSLFVFLTNDRSTYHDCYTTRQAVKQPGKISLLTNQWMHLELTELLDGEIVKWMNEPWITIT